MQQFILKDKKYSVQDLDPITALMICRKVSPLFVKMAEERPVCEALADLPQSDFEYLIKTILPKVSVSDEATKTWNVIVDKNTLNTVEFDNIPFPLGITAGTILEILFKVVLEYINDFFDAMANLEG